MSRDADTIVTSRATGSGLLFSSQQRLLALALTALAFFVISGCNGGNGTPAPAPLPVAANDSYTTGVGQTTLNVIAPGILGNDTGAGLTAVIDSTPAYASSFTLSPDGSFTYTHNNSFPNTTDSFTYHANNANGNSTIATVQINITPPVATLDIYSINSWGTAAGNVLSNDTPNTGVTAELVGGPAHAPSFTLNPDGTFSYPHNGDTATTDSFTYRAKIGAIASNTVSVTININQPPVATNGCFGNTFGAASVNGALTALDPEAGALQYEIVSPPTYGSITSGPDVSGNFVYSQSINSNNTFRRMDKFTYRVKDAENVYSNEATAWVLVDGKVRVMPVGDSITAGIWTGNTPATGDRAGYRGKLFYDLQSFTGAGHVHFVGRESDGANVLPMTDIFHEGYPGLRADQLALNTNVSTMLSANPPDIVLLHMGTNDLGDTVPSTVASAVTGILDKMKAWQNGATGYPLSVFVARIIDWAPNNLDVTTLNNTVASTVNGDGTYNGIMVNQQTGEPFGGVTLVYVIDTAAPYTGDMYNLLHPNPAGYDAMALNWYAAMTNTGNVGPKYLGLPECP